MQTKVCTKCNVEKPTTEYTKDRANKNGIRSECTICSRKMKRKDYRNNLEANLLRGARKRAKDKNLPFTIKKEDIVVPSICPLLNIEIKVAEGKQDDNSPSLDRIVPEKGYVKGNVWVICQRANWLKNNASLSELKMIVENLEKLQNER